MGIFGFNFVKNSEMTRIEKDRAHMAQTDKDFNWLLEHNASRDRTDAPMKPPIDTLLASTGAGAKIPLFPFPRNFLYMMARNVDALRIPIDVINRETIRNGFEIVPEWEYRCGRCGMEYQSKPIDETQPDNTPQDRSDQPVKCDVCGNTSLSQPKPRNRKRISPLLVKAWNNNGQHIKDVISELERDLDIADDAYLLLLKEYVIEDGRIVSSEVSEMQTIPPPQIFLISDYNGRLGFDERGRQAFLCPRHRQSPIFVDEDDELIERDPETGNPFCPECGCETLLAICETNSMYTSNIPSSQRMYFAKGEVIFSTGKYWRSKVYGYSPIYTVWSKVMALGMMDEYIRTYFDKQRPPKGLLVIGSRNYETLQKAFDKIKTDTKRDPYGLHPLMVENERGGRNMVQYVDLTGNLRDLEFTQIRDEFRRSIGAMYGVLPLFTGDLPQGWNQEGLEMAVTNRAVDETQNFLKETYLKPLCQLMGVQDWVIQLKTGEETDELRDEQFRAQKIQNATMMNALGYKHHLDGDGDFVFSSYPGEQEEPDSQLDTNSTSEEQMTNAEGEPAASRPSDPGGKMDGHPASGPDTSISYKSKRFTRIRGRRRRRR